ncbi:MAG: methyl-accepting chemotaxis protein [Spirochaetaceae bacterium]
MKSLTKKIISFFAIIAILPILFISIFSYVINLNQLDHLIKENLTFVAESKQVLLTNKLESYLRLAEFIINTNALKAGDVRESWDTLYRFQNQNWGLFHHIFITDTNGVVIVTPDHKDNISYDSDAHSGHLGHNISSNPYFKKSLLEPVITDFFGFEESTHYHQLLLYPVKNNRGEVVSVLVFEIDINNLISNENSEETNYYKTSLASLTGELIVNNKEDRGNIKYDINNITESINKHHFYTSYTDNTNIDQLALLHHEEEFPWVLITEIPKDIAHKSLNTNRFMLLTQIILFLFIAIAIVFMIRKLIKIPLEKVTNAINTLSGGDLKEIELNITSNDELGILANSYNILRKNLYKLINNLDSVIISSVSIGDTLKVAGDSVGEKIKNASSSSDEIHDKMSSLNVQIKESSNIIQKIYKSSVNVSQIVDEQSCSLKTSSNVVDEITNSIKSIDKVSIERQKDSVELNLKAENSTQTLNSSVKNINAVADSSNEMLDFISVINKISRQTNLLSMNAAIEAAHAGESGLGFSVVAEEIRKLSEQTSNNSKQISIKLKQEIKDIQVSADLTKKVGFIYSDIVKGISQITKSFEEVRSGANSLNINSDSIVDNILNIVTLNSQIKEISSDVNINTGILNTNLEELATISTDSEISMEKFKVTMYDTLEGLNTINSVIDQNSKNIKSLKSEINRFKL